MEYDNVLLLLVVLLCTCGAKSAVNGMTKLTGLEEWSYLET